MFLREKTAANIVYIFKNIFNEREKMKVVFIFSLLEKADFGISF